MAFVSVPHFCGHTSALASGHSLSTVAYKMDAAEVLGELDRLFLLWCIYSNGNYQILNSVPVSNQPKSARCVV